MNEGCLTIIFFAIVIALAVGFETATGITQCSATGRVLGYKTEWHYFTGCVVTKPDGNKVLLRQMRDTER